MATTPSTVQVSVIPTSPPPSTISPKVIASTAATLALSLLVAILTAVVNDPATLATALNAVPDWLRFILVAALPTLVTFLAGYAKRDGTRELGTVVQDKLHEPEPDGTDHEPTEAEVRTVGTDPEYVISDVPETADEFSGTTQEADHAE